MTLLDRVLASNFRTNFSAACHRFCPRYQEIAVRRPCETIPSEYSLMYTVRVSRDEIATVRGSCSEELAADTLSMVATLMKRARNARRRIWILPGTLGVATVLAASLFADKFVVVSCHTRANARPSTVTCTPTNTGRVLAILGATGKHISGNVTGWLVSRPAYEWTIGASNWYWVAGIFLSIVGSLILSSSVRHNKSVLMCWVIAGIAGTIIVLLFAKLGLPIPIVHLLAVCTVVCVAAFGSHSKSLAAVATVSFGAGAALSLHPQYLLPSLDVWIAPPSQGYVAAGMSLILGSIILYLRTRSLAWLPWRQRVEPLGQSAEPVL